MPERNSSSHDNIIHVSVTPDQPIVFEFAASQAFFGRSGNDLSITLENGEQILTEDYFIADVAGHLPQLQFADIPAVAGEVFLVEANPSLDISPAADAVRSGGSSSYSDNSGELISGLDGSDSQGSVFWSAASAQAITPASEGVLKDAAPVQPAPPVQPQPVPPVQPQPVPPVQPQPVQPQPVQPQPVQPSVNPDYEQRIVFYSLNANNEPVQQSEGAVIRFAVPQGTQATFVDSHNGFFSTFSTNDVKGVTYYELRLSDAGAKAMQQAYDNAQGKSDIGNVYDYITINVGGTTQVVQVILNQTGEYKSAAEDTANPHNQPQDIPEWHTQLDKANTADRVLGEADDRMWFGDHITTANSPGGNLLNLGDGDNTLNVAGSIFASGNDSTIISGDGNDDIKVKFIVQGAGANNTIDTGSGDDLISVYGEVLAQEGGNTLLKAVDGKVVLSSNVTATDTGNLDDSSIAQSNTIIAKNIVQDSNMGEGIVAGGANTANTLLASEDINIKVIDGNHDRSTGVFAEGSTFNATGQIELGSNTLQAGGNVNITVTAKGGNPATGVEVGDHGLVKISGDEINIDVQADGAAMGLNSHGAHTIGEGGITLEGNKVAVSAMGATGRAMSAEFGANGSGQLANSIVAKGSAVDAAGNSSFGNSSLNVELNAKSYAMYADGKGANGPQAGLSNNIVGSNADDVITANNIIDARNMGVNRILTGEGDDEVQVNSNLQASTQGVNLISAGDGNDNINVSSYLNATSDGQNLIDGGAGNDNINVSAYLFATSGGKNLIDGGEGDDNINVSSYLFATSGGKNLIDGGEGDNTISTAAMIASGNGQNTTNIIQTGDGNNNINLTTGFSDYTISSQGAGSQNLIITGAGNDKVESADSGMNIYTLSSAKTSINVGDGENEINIAGGVHTSGQGSVELLSGSGNDKISIGGQSATAGGSSLVVDAGGGDNVLTFAGGIGTTDKSSVEIKTGDENDTVTAQMLSAVLEGKNTINTGAGDDTVTIKGAMLDAMLAGTGGINEVTSNTVNVHGGMTGMNAQSGAGNQGFIITGDASNIITGNNVSVSAGNTSTTKDSFAMKATGQAGASVQNVIQAQGSQVDFASGTVSFGDTHGINAEITAVAEPDGTAMAMLASSAAANYVAGSDVDDTVTTQGYIRAENGGQNIISTGAGNDNITAKDAVQAITGGQNIIDAGAGDDTVSVAQLRAGFDASDNGSASNAILAGDGNDTITVGGSVTSAMYAVGQGNQNIVNAGNGNDNITIKGAVQATAGGQNIIDAGDGDDSMAVSGTLYATSGGSNVIDAGDGSNTLNITGQGQSLSIYSDGVGSQNIIRGGDGGNVIKVDKWANIINGASTTIETGAGDDVISFGASLMSQNKLGTSGSTVKIDAGDGDNTLNFSTAVSASHGFMQGDGTTAASSLAGKGSSLEISTGSGNDTLNINAKVSSYIGSTVDINAGDGDNKIIITDSVETHLGSNTSISTGSGDDTLLLKHVQSGGDAHTVIDTGSGKDTVTIDSRDSTNVKGLIAYLGGSNIINSDTVNIHGVDMGVQADRLTTSSNNRYVGADSASNVITANNVNISADNSGTSSTNNAYGLYAEGKADSSVHNVIQAQGSKVDLASGTVSFDNTHAITVVISAASGSADKAVAMLAKGTAVNYIVGGDGDDNITITGSVAVEANVDDDWGQNVIHTGDGNDTITIHGHVQTGALNIYAGEGNDMLVLVANSLEQFNDYYRDWLTEAANSEWQNMGIESVHVQVSDPSIDLADIAWLTSPGGIFNGFDVDVVFDSDYTLNIDGYDNGSSNLGDLVGAIEGLTDIDMSGGKSANTLNIDGLLNGIGKLDHLDEYDLQITSGDEVKTTDLVSGLVLRITGDAGEDKVEFGGNWSQEAVGSVEYGNVTYNIYTNSEESNQYVLVQQNLMM